MTRQNQLKGITTVLVVSLYVISLCMVGLTSTADLIDHKEEMRGYQILLMGWIGILDGTIAWYANIAFLFALGALWVDIKACTYASSIGAILALTAPLYGQMFLDEKAAPTASVHVGPGYYVWLCCFGVLLLAADRLIARERTKSS